MTRQRATSPAVIGRGGLHSPSRSCPAAFTLVELLVVIGIIGVLVGLLLPAVSRVRDNAKTAQCLSNLRQCALAANLYAATYRGFFPPAYYNSQAVAGEAITRSWDFAKIRTIATGQVRIEPGILWSGATNLAVQQCPSYEATTVGPSSDPFTGYNYNTSYIGRTPAEGVGSLIPARITQIRFPSQTLLFGDGQYSGGANKFMRSPFPDATDPFESRFAGTQGFRHRGKTNAAFTDGHVESFSDRFTETPGGPSIVGPGTGFLSRDNSLYDLQ